MNPLALAILLGALLVVAPPQQSITSLMGELHESPERARDAARMLDNRWGQERASEDTENRRELRTHEKELIEIVGSSKSNDVRSYIDTLLFKIDTPAARATASADVRRKLADEAAAEAVQKIRETTPQTLEQVTAVIHPSPDLTDDLKFSSSWNLLPDDPTFFVTLHESMREDQLLEIWERRGDQYNGLKSVSLHAGAAFAQYKTFKFGGETFYLVLVGISGSGKETEQYVYHVDRTARSLQDVKIKPVWQDLKLKPGEEIRTGPFVEFEDNHVSFMYGIRSPNESSLEGGDCVIERDASGQWILRLKKE